MARQDGSPATRSVHLLVAYATEENGVMADLRRRYGFGPVEWRAALARSDLTLPDSPGAVTPGEGGRSRADASGPDLMSVDQAAEFLGVHAQTVRNYIRSGKLTAYRLAGERVIRVLRKDLLALLEPLAPEETELPG